MYSLDVNALNFCPFSMLEVNYNYNTGRSEELLIAVPNLVESCWVRHARLNSAWGLILTTERQTFGSSHLVSVSTQP